MADYKELLRRAVGALPDGLEKDGGARRAVYEKSRAALVGQLRAVNPPLSVRDITAHRLQLEDCIRQVETEFSAPVVQPPAERPIPRVPSIVSRLRRQTETTPKKPADGIRPIEQIIADANDPHIGVTTSPVPPVTIAITPAPADDILGELARRLNSSAAEIPATVQPPIAPVEIPIARPPTPEPAAGISEMRDDKPPKKRARIRNPREELPPPDLIADATNASGDGYFVKPRVFSPVQLPQRQNYVSVMMPFDPEFDQVFETILKAGKRKGFKVERADKVWRNQAIIEDVFSMIFRSSIVICDFTSKRPNVMYEAGIAHTLGRLVLPLSRDPESELPFDIRHHHAVKYEDTTAGLRELGVWLGKYFKDNKTW